MVFSSCHLTNRLGRGQADRGVDVAACGLGIRPPSCRVPGIGFISSVLVEVLNFSGNLGYARSANVCSFELHNTLVPSAERKHEIGVAIF